MSRSAYAAAGPGPVSNFPPGASQGRVQQSQYGMQHLRDHQQPPDVAPAASKLHQHSTFSLPHIVSAIKPLPDHFRNQNPALYGATGSHQQHPLYRTSSTPLPFRCRILGPFSISFVASAFCQIIHMDFHTLKCSIYQKAMPQDPQTSQG